MAEMTPMASVLGSLEVCGLTPSLRLGKNEHGLINGHY